jgi:integrase
VAAEGEVMAVFVRRNKEWGFIEYDIKFTFPDGTPYRERRKSPVSTLDATRRWAAQREAHLLSVGPPKAKRAPVPTLNDFHERWIRDYCLANRHKPSGIAHKQLMLKAHLLPTLGDRRLDEIGARDIQEIKTRLADREPKTVNNVLVVLSKLLHVAKDWGELAEAPAVPLLRVERKEKAFLSIETYNKLLGGAADVSPACLALILLAGDAGLRRGEIFALRWSDIDLQRRFIVVQRSRVGKETGSTKGNASRHVPMTRTLGDVLEQLTRHGVLVLPKMTAKKCADMVRAAEAKAELPETGRLHVLRHTYASHAAMAGQSLYHLQSALGHQDHATTQGYAHLAPDALLGLADAVDRSRGRDTGENRKRLAK